MRIGWVVFLLALPGLAWASANISESPKSVRQAYHDGTWTELSVERCDDDGCDFAFRVGKRSASTTYPFSLRRHGYSLDLGDGYRYWPGNGGNFRFAVPVSCNDEDFALAGVATTVNLDCRILFSLIEGKVVAEGVDIFGVAEPLNRSLPEP